ncbi:hypothetical protein QUF90_20165 [Desulfococcaceae bacterium HSG9]|nr:hypothetical protein [Desulfococcaceae bacterium HSG9]
MYSSIRGIYKKGKIIPIEPIENDKDEIDVIITLLIENNNTPNLNVDNSDDEILRTMGERSVEGKFSDASESHDQYLYGAKCKK